MINPQVVWFHETTAHGYPQRRQVEVDQNGLVVLSSWEVGKRGGVISNGPAFTPAEWAEVQAAVAANVHVEPPWDPHSGLTPTEKYRRARSQGESREGARLISEVDPEAKS